MTAFPQTHTAFGDFRILPGNLSVAARQQYSSTNCVTAKELAQLQSAWNNMQQGVGLRVLPDGVTVPQSSPQWREAKNQWDGMLERGLATSASFRQLFINICLTNPSINPIEVQLGNDRQDVLGDSYHTNLVDIGDLRSLPSVPGKNNPNEFTQTEAVIHILAERQASFSFPSGADVYDSDHSAAISAQNMYRDERGQVHVDKMESFPGAVDGHFRVTLVDGTYFDIWIVLNQFITFPGLGAPAASGPSGVDSSIGDEGLPDPPAIEGPVEVNALPAIDVPLEATFISGIEESGLGSAFDDGEGSWGIGSFGGDTPGDNAAFADTFAGEFADLGVSMDLGGQDIASGEIASFDLDSDIGLGGMVDSSTDIAGENVDAGIAGDAGVAFGGDPTDADI